LIVWLNGAFGVGKTSAAAAMAGLGGRLGVFDPEEIGALLTRVRRAPSGDFQDLPAWRRLVTLTTAELAGHAAGPLVVPMTVLDEGYAREIFNGVRSRAHDVAHVVLHCEPDELAARIDGDRDGADRAVWVARRDWRHSRRPAYYRALPWLHCLGKPLVIDTTHLSPVDVARRVLRCAGIAYDDGEL
jgi:hypothetical protein